MGINYTKQTYFITINAILLEFFGILMSEMCLHIIL